LFGQELVAIDGTKLKAVNSKRRNFTHAKLHETLQRLDAHIEQYLHDLDAADADEAESQQTTAEHLREKIQELRERKARYEGLRRQMEISGQSQVSLTDPDSRAMPKSPKVDVGYNAQVAVDDKQQLLVVQEVTKAVTDVDQLSGIAIQAQAALEVEQVKVMADMGYDHGEELKACEEAGIEPYVAKPLTSANRTLGLYGKEQFTYEPEHDRYRCPAGQALTFRFATVELGRSIRYDATTACRAGAIKARGTRKKERRRITRWVHEHLLARTQQRVEAHPALMKRRKQIVEHPFGTIKHWPDQGYFLMKGLEKVRAEFSLSTLAYNLRRVTMLLGVPYMLHALG
jgi:Transposase DDE domain